MRFSPYKLVDSESFERLKTEQYAKWGATTAIQSQRIPWRTAIFAAKIQVMHDSIPYETVVKDTIW